MMCGACTRIARDAVFEVEYIGESASGMSNLDCKSTHTQK